MTHGRFEGALLVVWPARYSTRRGTLDLTSGMKQSREHQFASCSTEVCRMRTAPPPRVAGPNLLRADRCGLAVRARNAGRDLKVNRLRHGGGWIRGHRLGRVLQHGENEGTGCEHAGNAEHLQWAHGD